MDKEQYKEFLELLAECDKRPKNTSHNKDKNIFIDSAKFLCKFKEYLNRNIINEQMFETIIETKDYKVFQTEFGEIKIKDEKI